MIAHVQGEHTEAFVPKEVREHRHLVLASTHRESMHQNHRGGVTCALVRAGITVAAGGVAARGE